MSLTKRRYTYVDFTTQPQVPIIQKDLSAVMTATNTQINTFDIGGNHFEMLQINAAKSTAFTPSATGWLLPIGATDHDGLAFCQGSIAATTHMKFLSGTDGFFLKVKLIQSVVADTDVVAIGFREAGTTQVTSTGATALLKTDYDHKALYGVGDDTGACYSEVSNGAGVDTETLATMVSVTTVAMTLEVRIHKDLTVEFYHDDVLDELAAVPAPVVTTGKTFVPHMIFVSSAAGVEKVELCTYECGLLDE